MYMYSRVHTHAHAEVSSYSMSIWSVLSLNALVSASVLQCLASLKLPSPVAAYNMYCGVKKQGFQEVVAVVIIIYIIISVSILLVLVVPLQCCDTVGWVTGRASGL